MDFKRDFSLPKAYEFLNSHNLEQVCEDIKISSDEYKSYKSTLRRAKIINVVVTEGLLDDFCKEVWPSGFTDKGRSRMRFLENLLLRFNNEEEGLVDENEEIEEALEESGFAYEDDLRNYLVKNLSVIEDGLRLYNEGGISGEEFYIAGTRRRIDILAIDKNNAPVVIELKVKKGHEKVVGQALFYQSSIRTLFKEEKVRVIIIAREILEEIKIATQYLLYFELFEYQLSISLNRR